MDNKLNSKDKIYSQGVFGTPIDNKINLTANWKWEHIRNNNIIDSWSYNNTCSDQGLNHMLNVTFSAITPISQWYVEIFDDNVTPDGNTTYAVPVYTSCTLYDEVTRPTYINSGASGKVVTSSVTPAVFTISGTTTIYGAALVGGGTSNTIKGDKIGGGTLFSASKFNAVRNVIDNDVLNVTISITLADT